MTISLRSYQKTMVLETYAHISAGQRRILLVAVMSAGKTITGGWMLRDAANRGKRSVFLVDLKSLLDQTADEFRSLGIHCTILQGNRLFDQSAPVIVASRDTITARLKQGYILDDILGPIDLLMADEAHDTSFSTVYQKLVDHYPDVLRIGLTATPWRRSRKQWLGQKYDALVVGPQPPEIIRLGGAVPCRGFSIGGVLDLETLKVSGGDYSDSSISQQACQLEALNHVYREWKRLASDRSTLMIGSTVAQAQMTMEKFQAEGVPTEIIIGSTTKEQRDEIFNRIKTGETQVITSVGCLTKGFSLKPLSAILFVRATKSKALFHQCCGRACRPFVGKDDYLLLDFGGNLKRHGNPMAHQDYDISEKPQREIEPMLKTCPECFAEISQFAAICPSCGYVFNEAVDDDDEQEELVLNQLSEHFDRFTKKKVKALRDGRKQAWKSWSNPDQPINKFVSTYGHTPPDEWLLYASLGKRSSQKRKQRYIDYLEH
ncbi:MAG: DEAD/DEAH box helicase family protein, partial [Cyanobacteria bacterium J06627_3]